MFKQFKKKIAATLNLLLVLNLVIFGLGSNASMAKATSSMKLNTNISESKFVAGKSTEFNVRLSNIDGNNYEAVKAAFEISNVADKEISELMYFDSADSKWKNLPYLASEGSVFGLFGPAAGFAVNDTYDVTSKFKVTFTRPNDHLVTFTLSDPTIQNSVIHSENFSVEGVTTLDSLDWKDTVKNSDVYPFSVTLDNTFGEDYKFVLGKFIIKNTLKSDIKSLEYYEVMTSSWETLPVTEQGADLVGSFGPATGFPLNNGDNNTSEFKVTFNTEKTYSVEFSVIDLEDNSSIVSKAKSVVSDGSVSEIKVLPTLVNSIEKDIKVNFISTEKLNSIMVGYFQKSDIPVVPGDKLAATKVDDYNFEFTIPAGSLKSLVNPIELTYVAKDLLGNEVTKTVIINVDSMAPQKLSNISAVVNASGKVVLTWENPNLPTDYSVIRVYRNGETAPLAELPVGTTSFVDESVEKGQTYYYEIVLVDEAGNTTKNARIDVSTPAPVVAAVASDTTVVTPPKNDSKEVKSETDESTETKEDKKDKFPLWVIVVLVVLAAIGGYLYFTKDGKVKPIAQNAPVAKKKSPTKKPTKKK